MPELVPMPKLGFDMAEGTLVRKVKKEGEAVKKGEVLAEIETDKATVEVESPATGVVKGWVVEEGKPVPVGALMAVIGAADEQVDLKALAGAPTAAAEPTPAESKPAPTAEAKPAEAKPAEAKPAEAKPAPAASTHGNGHQEGTVAPAARGAAAPASPIARKMAADAGADLSQITGTGPGGRITKKDVEAYLSQPKPAAEPAPTAAAAPTTVVGSSTAAPTPARPAPAMPLAAREDETVPLTRMRQIIARRMTESTTTIPQFYVNTEIDMAAAMDLRKQLNALLTDDAKLSVNDLVIKAVALTLRDFPNLNASFAGDKVIRKGHVNVGNAVAIPAGLLTVVVRDADLKSLSLIAAEMKAMVGRVREGKVQGADIEGSTFSISNLGKWDVDSFVAIINPPEAAILAVGTVKQVPVVQNGAIVPGMRMLATLAADHRVTDGAEAAEFMQALKAKLEAPLRLVL